MVIYQRPLYCSELKYEFCIKYSLSIGFMLLALDVDGVNAPPVFSNKVLCKCAACKSKFCSDSVSDVASSR